MAEYKNCPVCHTINPPAALTCECGYKFRSGDALTDRDIARAERKKKLRAALLTAPLVLIIIVLCVITPLYGIRPLLYALAAAAVIFVAAAVIFRIKSRCDRKRMGNNDKQHR